jgi:hypothetical protein
MSIKYVGLILGEKAFEIEGRVLTESDLRTMGAANQVELQAAEVAARQFVSDVEHDTLTGLGSHVEAEGILLAAGIAHGEWTAEEYAQALELAGYEGGTDGSAVAVERIT